MSDGTKCETMREKLERELQESLKTMLSGKVDQTTLDAYLTEVAKEELQRALKNYNLKEAIQKIIWDGIVERGAEAAEAFLNDPEAQKQIEEAAKIAVIKGIAEFSETIKRSLANALRR